MKDSYLYNEKQTLRKASDGDERAFSLVVQQYAAIIYHHLMMQLRDHQLAQDLTQNIFISLWKNREGLKDIDNFPGYIYRMARNTSYKAFLKLVEEHKQQPSDQLNSMLDNPQTTLEAKELQRVIADGIAALPRRRREVFELSRLEDMSYEKIADYLNISRSAVKHHIVAARIFLREYIKRHAHVVPALFTMVFINF